MTDIVEFNGYRLDAREVFEAEADPALIKRASAFPGELILWDPNDDADGFLLVGDDRLALVREFKNHFGEYLETSEAAQ